MNRTTAKLSFGILCAFFVSGVTAVYAADWIAVDEPLPSEFPVATLTRAVTNEAAVVRAELTCASLGVFEGYVNGRELPDVLKPGYTHHDKRRHELTFDVTESWKKAAGSVNDLKVLVSSGWWRDKVVWGWHEGRKQSPESAFRATLTLVGADGQRQVVATDASWRGTYAGPYREASIFGGEVCDRTQPEAVGRPVRTANGLFRGAVVPREGPPVVLREDLAFEPKSIWIYRGVKGATTNAFGTVDVVRRPAAGEAIDLKPGETCVFDFGQNCAAWAFFRFSAPRGTRLVARFSEMLNDGNGAKARGCDGPEGSPYLAALRKAKARLEYVFAGSGEEEYHPTFTFMGYRYLAVTVDGPVRLASVRSVPVSSVSRGMENGSIETGNALLNKLISNIRWGHLSNYLSVPTDCPQRDERQGWGADTQVFAPAACWLADVDGFLAKFLSDARDTQDANGSYGSVMPGCGDRVPRFGWTDAGVIVTYVLYRRYGDTDVIRANLPAMEKFVDLVAPTWYASPTNTYQFADWLAFEGCAKRDDRYFNCDFLAACHLAEDARMLAEMAAAVGDGAAAARYADLSEKTRRHLRTRFLPDGDLSPRLAHLQTAQLFALRLGLASGKGLAALKARLRANFAARGNRLATGFLGTAILLDGVADGLGDADLAYTLLLQEDHPSWLYSVNQGATTVWERWNSYTKAKGFGDVSMNSFNHYAYGSVLDWMYRRMAGIDAAAPGFARLRLAPLPDRRIGWCKARYRTPHGEVRSDWRYDRDGAWHWRFTVPQGTTATVELPGGKPAEYGPGDHEIHHR